MKNITTIIAILLIGFGVYYFANEYTTSKQVSEQVIEQSAGEENMQGAGSGNTDGNIQGNADVNAQGKININEVCEGALIRMTFIDGAAAEKFVAECKEGKHPEVIEQFKAEMNLGEGAEI